MMRISETAFYFQIPGSEEEETKWAIHVPDAVVTAIIKTADGKLKKRFVKHLDLLQSTELQLPPLNRHKVLIPEPRLPWHEACGLVVGAYEAFDRRLGARVKEALSNPSRMRLTEVEPGAGGGSFLGYIAETERVPAPIAYERDGTVNDVLYLAHELGSPPRG